MARAGVHLTVLAVGDVEAAGWGRGNCFRCEKIKEAVNWRLINFSV